MGDSNVSTAIAGYETAKPKTLVQKTAEVIRAAKKIQDAYPDKSPATFQVALCTAIEIAKLP